MQSPDQLLIGTGPLMCTRLFLHESSNFDYLGWLQYLYKRIKYQYQISNIKYRILIWNINTISQICCGSGSLPDPVLPCSPYQAGQPGAGGGNRRANNRIFYEYLGPARIFLNSLDYFPWTQGGLCVYRHSGKFRKVHISSNMKYIMVRN